MWTEIDAHISRVTGEKFQTQQRRSVSGGCINQGYAVSNAQLTYFVKLNQASQVAMFEAEALGLADMLATASIRVPQPLCWSFGCCCLLGCFGTVPSPTDLLRRHR